MLLWSIWHRRNDIVWNDGSRDPTTVIKRADARNSSPILSSLQGHPRTPLWQPPRPGFLKCNVDASVPDHSVAAGFGAVIRNHSGDFISAKSTPIAFRPSVRECEAYALRDAIQWVANMTDSNVIFETDAKVVVDAIYNPVVDDTEFGDIIKDIRNRLNASRDFSVHAISREANEMAHLTARHSRSLAGTLIFSAIPAFLTHCMNNCNTSSSNRTDVAQMGDGNAEAH